VVSTAQYQQLTLAYGVHQRLSSRAELAFWDFDGLPGDIFALFEQASHICALYRLQDGLALVEAAVNIEAGAQRAATVIVSLLGQLRHLAELALAHGKDVYILTDAL